MDVRQPSFTLFRPFYINVQRIRLVRKLAPILNGLDLSAFHVGDVIRVSDAIAAMLIREGWGELLPNDEKIADP